MKATASRTTSILGTFFTLFLGTALTTALAQDASKETSPETSPKTSSEAKEFELSGLSKIEVRNHTGNIDVSVSSSSKALVTIDKKSFGDHCKLTMERSGDKLVVSVKKTGLFKSNCHADFKVEGPKSAALELYSSRGNITAKGITGDVLFAASKGEVTIDGEVKKLDGKASSGGITINGLTSGGTIRVGSGKINLAYKAVPKEGELDIKAGSGSAEVTVPQNAKFKTSFGVGSGSLQNNVGEFPESGFTISMRAGAGDLVIKSQ